MSSSPERRRYIDVARGVAVLIMIEAHALDAWTRLSDHDTIGFRNLTIVGGFAAPLFLWLAGIVLVLGAERAARTRPRREVMRAAARRGLVIFALAFLFRLQAFVVSPGSPLLMLLRVDILNVMGPAIAAAAVVWGVAGGRRAAGIWCAVIAVSIAMVTPLVRAAAWVDVLPACLQWYLRPAGEHTTFTLLPWAGFVFAGGAVGALMRPERTAVTEYRLIALVTFAGAAFVALGFYTASRPALYSGTSFWTSSPTYFAVRTGVMMLLLAGLFAVERLAAFASPGIAVLERLGTHSLFVYWIHVELVYGYITWGIHHRLSLPVTIAAYVVFCTLMYLAIGFRDRVAARFRGAQPNLLHLWYLEGPVGKPLR